MTSVRKCRFAGVAYPGCPCIKMIKLIPGNGSNGWHSVQYSAAADAMYNNNHGYKIKSLFYLITMIITTACPQKTVPLSLICTIRNTWKISLKFLQQNLAHICTLCAKIRGNLTQRSYFITCFQLLVQNTSFRPWQHGLMHVHSCPPNEAVW